ncbi:hypothetical protein ACFW2V_12695 [Streptomyces sp. NPDC058947]|uniref:hypothetical protein n=1 Tax=Streptomyces sp. NPDC058947 TaxID=3346675 RepID=UPI003678015E
MGIKYEAGDQVFDPVAEELLQVKAQIGEEAMQRILSKLVGGLLSLGWGNADGTLGAYEDEATVVAAFAQHGVKLACMSENAEHGGVCEEDRGHYPGIDHKDFRGWTWGDEEAVQ